MSDALADAEAWLGRRKELLTNLVARRTALLLALSDVDIAIRNLGGRAGKGVPKPGTKVAAILDYVTEHPGCTATEVSRAIPGGGVAMPHMTIRRGLLRRERSSRPPCVGAWRYWTA